MGGVRVGKPSDLAVLLAVVSSARTGRFPPDLICFGEIGLSGEEAQLYGPERLREAVKHGFKRAKGRPIYPKSKLVRWRERAFVSI